MICWFPYIAAMWKDFRALGHKVSYEVYRQVCGLENISFRKPVKRDTGVSKKRIRKPKQKVVMDGNQLMGEILNVGIISTTPNVQLPQEYMTTSIPQQQQANHVAFFNMPADNGAAVNFSYNRGQTVPTAAPVNYSFNKTSNGMPTTILEPHQNAAENMVMTRTPTVVEAATSASVPQTVVNYSFNKPPIYVNNHTEGVLHYNKLIQNSVPVNYSFNKDQQQTMTANDISFNRITTEPACLLYNNINPTQ